MLNHHIAMLLVTTALLSSSQVFAANLKCMPQITDHAVRAFEIAKVNGIVAEIDDQTVELGRDVEPRSVEIRDVHKNAYTVRFHLGSDVFLKTFIYGVNYDTCTVEIDREEQLLNPAYRLFR